MADTVSIEHGSQEVIGDLTNFVAAEGDLLIAGGYVAAIASAPTTSRIVLQKPWSGPTIAGEDYTILNWGEYWRSTATVSRKVVELIERLEGGLPLKPDASGTLANRAQYNNQLPPFFYLRTDVDPFLLYAKTGPGSNDWSNGQRLQADQPAAMAEAVAAASLAREWANKMTGAVADGEFSSKHYSQVSKIEADRSKGEADRAVTEANRSASEANRAETAKASADASVATIATHAAEAKTARDSSAQSAQQSAQSAGQAGSGPASKLYYDLLNKVVVSATGVVDTFVYDTTLDDDRGQWIYKCGWTTYFNEPLNVANVRGGRREHPVVAGIVLRAGRLDILDLQDLDTATGTPRLWKSIFPAAGPHAGAELWRQAQRAGKCVWARNGLLLWGIDIGSAEDGASGLCYIDWSIDEFGRYPGTSAAAGGRAKGIINATVANGHILDDSLPVIVSSQVHDVHAEVLPGAPLNAAGLPIPHIVVGTQSGFSVILPNGTVWDMTGSTAWSVRLLKDGTIRAAVGGTGIVRDYAMLTADILSTQHQTEWNPIANFPRPLGGWVGVVSDDAIGNKSSSAGLTFLAKAADKASSMVSYATINYVTGWQPGDIRLAALGEGAVGNVSDYPELVSNGSAFADTAGWSSDANTTLTASPTGNLVISVASGSGFAWTTIPTVAGKAYRVSFDLVTGSGFFRVGVGAHTDGSLIPAGSIGSAGRKIYSFVASGPTSYLTFSVSGTNASMAIDNVSVKEDVVVNGTFDRDLTSWRLFTGTDGSITWSGGAALLVSTASSTVYIRQTLTTIPGTSYRLEFDTSGALNLSIGTTDGGTQLLSARSVSGAGTHSFEFIATTATSYLQFYRGAGSPSTSLDNVSVRPVIVTNGAFVSDLTGWEITTGDGTGSVTWDNGAAKLTTSATSSARVSQKIVTIPGQTYVLTADLTTGQDMTVAASRSGHAGTDLGSVVARTGRVTLQFTAATTETYFQFYKGAGSTAAGFVDNVTVTPAVPDRSYKGKGLNVVGTLQRTTVASGADLTWTAGFSLTDYLEMPASPELDFGTGDFSYLIWAMPYTDTATNAYILRRTNSTGPAGRISIVQNGVNLAFAVGPVQIAANGYLAANRPVLIEASRRSGVLRLKVNGELVGTAASTQDVSFPDARFTVGAGNGNSAPGANAFFPGAVALLRAAAYCPTDEQSRQIYRDELPLFQAGSKCFLGGASNVVNDIDFDEQRNTLVAGTGDGVSEFVRFRRINYFEALGSIALTNDIMKSVASRGGFRLFAGGAQAVAYREPINGVDALAPQRVPTPWDLDKKADKAVLAALESTVGQKADKSYVDTELGKKANLASPALTGTPTAPTAATGTNTTQIATTAFVKSAIDALVTGAPGALDTLDELAAALGDDPNFATTVLTSLSNRLRFDAAQTLTAAQRQQALDNLGAPAVAMKNRLINACFIVRQRGDAAVSATGAYPADRWRLLHSGTVSVNCGIAGNTDTSLASTIHAYIQCTGAKASLAAGDYVALGQRVEGVHALDLKWGTPQAKPITISFRALPSVPNTVVSVAVRNADGTRSYVKNVTLAAGAGTYRVTIPGCSDGTWNVSTGTFLEFTIAVACGTTYRAPSEGGWLSGNYLAAPGISNLLDTLARYVNVADLQLEAGYAATEYDYRSYPEEFRLCARYFLRKNVSIIGNCFAGSALYGNQIDFPTPMRAFPSYATIRIDENINNAQVNVSVWPDCVRIHGVSTASGNAFWTAVMDFNAEL